MWIDDQILERYPEQLATKVFIPDFTAVVLGSGNDETKEVHLDYCASNNIPVLRRYGGGGTVVLYPGCVVVTIGCWVDDPFQNSFFFSKLNQSVIESLARSYPECEELTQSGISDIVYRDRKVAGTSLFRSRNYLLYQASLLVTLDHELISNALAHPSKEPDYRQGRSHRSFLTDLQTIIGGENINSSSILKALQENIEKTARETLGPRLVNPVEAQFPSLVQRLARS